MQLKKQKQFLPTLFFVWDVISYYKIKNRLKSIRIIASSSQELDTKVQNNSFSKSLYAEFNFLNVHIPPLRERKEDIPLIIEKLIAKHKIYDEIKLQNQKF